MNTKELINEIQKLPLKKQIFVVERTMQIMRKQEEKSQMKTAADALYEDYMADKELTQFTNLDFENFYEAR